MKHAQVRLIGSALVETWQEMARGSGVPGARLHGSWGLPDQPTVRKPCILQQIQTDLKSCCMDTLKRHRPRHRHIVSQTKQKVVSPPRHQTCASVLSPSFFHPSHIHSFHLRNNYIHYPKNASRYPLKGFIVALFISNRINKASRSFAPNNRPCRNAQKVRQKTVAAATARIAKSLQSTTATTTILRQNA